MSSKVAVVFTRPETVLEDYRRVMELASWQDHLRPDRELLLKLNLSWTKYFPSCSSQPWQVEGVIKTLKDGGFPASKLIPIENKTVVTNPVKGARNNAWQPVLDRYGLKFQPLTDVEWKVYRFKSPLLKLNHIFPEGIEIPSIYPGRDILHMPTVKTHGHSVTTLKSSASSMNAISCTPRTSTSARPSGPWNAKSSSKRVSKSGTSEVSPGCQLRRRPPRRTAGARLPSTASITRRLSSPFGSI